MYISRARLALHSIETIFALFTIFDNSTDFDFLVISGPSDVWSRVSSNIAAKKGILSFRDGHIRTDDNGWFNKLWNKT